MQITNKTDGKKLQAYHFDKKVVVFFFFFNFFIQNYV